jgi:hypothetical protein
MKVTYFDLLGIDHTIADRAGAAAAMWPKDVISTVPGFHLPDDADALTIANNLFNGTVFRNVRPAVDGRIALGSGATGQISFAADMDIVGPLVTNNPFYLSALPDLGILLKVTDAAHPATVFFAVDGRGHEVIIDQLPVKLFLKAGLASALSGAPVSVGSFDPTAIDTFAYTLNDENHSAEIECYVRVHLTVEGDIILESTVPISFGPVRWMGLPAKAVYDVQLLPAPSRTEYLEWTHNDPGSFLDKPLAQGALGFRSIEVDFSLPPFSDLRTRVQNGAVHLDNLELVLEDVVVPVTSPMLPIPSHGTFGFRRKITDRGDIKEAYSLSGAPVQIPIYGSTQQGGNGGSSLTLQVEKFFFRTGDIDAFDPADQPQLQFQAALIFQTTTGQKLGPTMGIDEEWTFTAGMVIDIADTPVKMTIADTTIGLVGFKVGVSVGRLGKGIPFKDSFELLGDLYVSGLPSGGSSFFKITSLTGKPLSVVIRDLGYKLGHFSLDGLQMPDGMQLVFANTVKIIIEELGWVEEPNGTPYFSFSGGVAIGGSGGGKSVKPSGDTSDKDGGSGFGIRVRRLRFRLNSDGSQPFFKLDGIFLKLAYGPVDVEGFGYISDFTADGWAIKEWGFGVKVALDLMAMKFSLAAEFIKGKRTNLSDASQDFDYFLAALELGFLPAGPIGLYDIRALVADNMAPNLDATFPDGEGMVLLKWHQNHDTALSMPASRTLADWIAEKGSFDFGVGCGFSLNGCGSALHLSIFIFFAKSKADTGILIVGELYLLKNPKPIAFVAIEYDIDKDKFGVMIGIDLNVGDFASGSVPNWLADIARLTGTMYLGNKPWAFAIGQLADQSTWLSLKIDFDIWITIKFMLGVCVQIVDGGPKGFGLVFTLSAGANWGIGSFILWGTFGLIFGTWKTGSDASGLEFWIELGFKIRVFWVFSFGAEISLKITYIGKHPWYVTLHAEIKIDTPWFLPDVTFTIDKTWQEPLPFDTSTVTQSLSKASGLDIGQKATPLLVPGLVGALGDAGFVYTFNQLDGLTGARIADPHLRTDIPIVSVDATIAIDLSQPVSNDSAIATSTYDGTTDTGVQKVSDLNLRYGLKSIAVRRAPRFGPTAGVWSDLVTDAETQFSIGGAAPETINFCWDPDSRADGKLAPKRLKINSSSPYSFITKSAQNDEEAARNDADFPCCDRETERKSLPRSHVLEFSGIAMGVRVPRNERFSGVNGAWWTWVTATTPAVVPGDPVYPSGHVARVSPRASVVIGSVDLTDPAMSAQLECSWERLPATLIFEGYSGLKRVALQSADMNAAGSSSLTLTVGAATTGMTRLLLRVEVDEQKVFGGANAGFKASFVAVGFSALAQLGIYRISYVTLSDVLRYAGAVQRCKNGAAVGPPGSDASGKLAFLPNHDYEIVITSAINVGAKDAGARTLEVSEALYFRTKGLPGLNAAENVGDDIRPHVDMSYPKQRATPLYRLEPCVLALENSLSSVLPIDRTPLPGDPPEKAQMFPLELNVDRVVSLDGLKRLTVPSDDWIWAHRANPYPRRYTKASSGFAKAKVRFARSHDELVLRHEAVKMASPGCGPAKVDHASQVLLHEPIDGTGSAGPWEATTGYRATVRQKDGAFTERSGFDIYDLGAFIKQADGGAAPVLWSVDSEGNLIAPGSGGGRHYATCGEATWDHLQVHSHIDLGSASAAGIAVCVGNGTPVPTAYVATVENDGGGHALVMRLRDGSGERELGRAAVQISGPFLLAVTSYDDIVRATVGSVSVDGARGALREGRVALVADGPAAFAGIAVGAIDIYAFDFVTSAYGSFSEHLGTYDGELPTLAAGAFGGTPTAVGTVLAAHATDCAALMQRTADPQERQKLFDAVVGALGIGLQKTPKALTISRLVDAGGSFGFIVQSPEPISLTRDVALTLTKHVRRWVPGPVWPPLYPAPIEVPTPIHDVSAVLVSLESVARHVLSTLDQPAAVQAPAPLSELNFAASHVTVPEAAAHFGPQDRVARITRGPAGDFVELYRAPSTTMSTTASGALIELIPVAEALKRPDLAAVAALDPGTIALLPGGGTGPIWHGHWIEEDVPIPFVPLANGAETSILILSQSGAPLGAGTYVIHAVLDRSRWRASTVIDPEQSYHDEQAIMLHW